MNYVIDKLILEGGVKKISRVWLESS